MHVSTRDRLERVTRPFRPGSSPRRLMVDADHKGPFAETVAATISEASLGGRMHKLILVGTGQLDVEGASGGWLIVAGHLVVVPAERAFRMRSESDTTLIVAHLDPADTAWTHQGCWATVVMPLAREMLTQAARWSPAEVAANESARLFFRALSGLCAEWFTNTRLLWFPAVKSKPMRRAVLHLHDHLDDALLNEVAAAAGLSGRTLQRHCQAELGISWRDLVPLHSGFDGLG